MGNSESTSDARSSMELNARRKQEVTRIADNYTSVEEAGLHSTEKSLHAIGTTPNPYEQTISTIGRTLTPFDEDNLIPCFGFGVASTHDQHVFSFYPSNRPCHGFEEALARYREILPYINLSGYEQITFPCSRTKTFPPPREVIEHDSTIQELPNNASGESNEPKGPFEHIIVYLIKNYKSPSTWNVVVKGVLCCVVTRSALYD